MSDSDEEKGVCEDGEHVYDADDVCQNCGDTICHHHLMMVNDDGTCVDCGKGAIEKPECEDYEPDGDGEGNCMNCGNGEDEH